MITKFENYNESIRSLLVGPTDDELLQKYKGERPVNLLWNSVEIGWLNGIKIAFEKDNTLIKYIDRVLVESAGDGFLDIVKYTIENGADIHIWSDAPLNNAAEFGHYDVVKYLLENGADVYATHRYEDEDGSEKFNSYEVSLNNDFVEVAKLIKSYMNKPTNEGVQTELVVDVTNKDDDFITKLVNVLSFDYKKRKDRKSEPINITGNMTPDIDLNIILSNKDIIKVEYLNNEDLKVSINNKLLYYDDIVKDNVFNKIFKVYTKYLNEQKFKITQGHPF